MNAQYLAALLDDGQYPLVIDDDLLKQTIENNLVICYGASDDLMCFDGVYSEELDASLGCTLYLWRNSKGLTATIDADYIGSVVDIDSLSYIKTEGFSAGKWYLWAYDTNIPHEKFVIRCDSNDYCQGIVFNFNDVKQAGIIQ